MSDTIKRIVIDVATTGVSAAVNAISGIKKGVDSLNSKPVQQMLSGGAFGPGVAQATNFASTAMQTIQSLFPKSQGVGGAGGAAKVPKAADFDTTKLQRGEDGIWRMPAAPAGGAGGAGMGNAARLLANPYTALAAAVLAAAASLRQLKIWARELSETQLKSDSTFRGIISGEAAGASARHVSQAMQRTEMAGMGNAANFRSVFTQSQLRGEREAGTRAEQDELESRGASYDRRQEIRSRRDTQTEFQVGEENVRLEMANLAEQESTISGARERMKQDQAKAEEEYNRHIKSIQKRKVAVPEKAGWFNGVVGERTRDEAMIYNREIDGEINAAVRDRAGQKNKDAEDEVKLAKQSLEIGKQRAQAASNLLTLMRQQTLAARRNYEIDKETQASANRSLGAMSQGDLTRLRSLDAKRKRIEEGSQETLSQWELEQEAPEGTKLSDFIRQQREKRGEGVLERNVDLDKSKAEMEAAQARENKEAPSLQKSLDEITQKNATKGEELLQAMEKAMDMEDFFAKAQAIFEKQQQEIKDSIATMKRWLK